MLSSQSARNKNQAAVACWSARVAQPSRSQMM